MRTCKRCLLDDSIAGVKIGDSGQCNYCDMHDNLEKEYPVSMPRFMKQIAEIKRRGKKSKYDCLIGISGGTDSSYMMYLAHEYGLRVLAFHFDNGWNTEIAERNMTKMVEATGADFIRIRVNDIEYNKLNKAFLLASVSDADIPNDIAMAKLMLTVARQNRVKTILNGHSFRTEGSCPIGWTYMDGAYVADVYVKQYNEELKSYPLLSIWDQVRQAWWGIKQVRILYHLPYRKENAKKRLIEFYGWEDYGGHHCENVYTEFVGWYIKEKFGIDKRRIELSAFIRSGFITKEDAMDELEKPVGISVDLLDRVRKKLGIDIQRWHEILGVTYSPRRTYHDFKTYKSKFERLRWLVWLAVRFGFLPRTFYVKYCTK